MIVVPNKSSAWLEVEFKDRTGAMAAPDSARYRIDIKDGDEVKEWTSISDPGSQEEILLTPADNTLTGTNTKEHRLVTVHATFGDDDERYEDYLYKVVNVDNA